MRHHFTVAAYAEDVAAGLNLALERLSGAALYVRVAPSGLSLELRLRLPSGHEGVRHDIFVAGPYVVCLLSDLIASRPLLDRAHEFALMAQEARDELQTESTSDPPAARGFSPAGG